MELPGCCSDKVWGHAVARLRDSGRMRLTRRWLTDDVHVGGTVSHMDVEAR